MYLEDGLFSQMDLAGAIHVERLSKGRCATIAINEMTFPCAC